MNECMMNCIVTSEHDNNYFIINNEVFNIIWLTQLLSKRNIEIANILAPTITNPFLKNEKIFIAKESALGNELEKLIKEKALVDESKIIKEIYLQTALISAVVNNKEQEYIDLIIKLIKEKVNGPIETLKNIYDENLLKTINFDGRINDYIKENKVISGFEINGITYYDNEWQYIDITRREITSIENKDVKVRIKTNKQ